MLAELSRKLLVAGAVAIGLYVLVEYGPDLRTADEAVAEARVQRVVEAAKQMPKAEVLTEYAKASAYAEKCSFDFDDGLALVAMKAAGITGEQADLNGIYRSQVEDGLTTVAMLTSGSDIHFACDIAMAAYGADGTVLPGLVSK